MTARLETKSSILARMPLGKFRFWFLVFLMLILLWLITSYGVMFVRVSGHSMNPTLHDGQFLLLQRYQPLFNHPYKHGDIVVLNKPEELQSRASRFVKRLIALPGDTVSIQDDKVFLNGQRLEEPYVAATSTRAEDFPELVVSKGEVVAFEGFALAELPEYLKDTLAMLEPLPQKVLEGSQNENVTYIGTIRLKKDFYFVLGDNRGFRASEDSRLFGAIPTLRILGTVRPFKTKF